METFICRKCNGIAYWDPYFNSIVCTRCGNMERKEQIELYKKSDFINVIECLRHCANDYSSCIGCSRYKKGQSMHICGENLKFIAADMMEELLEKVENEK